MPSAHALYEAADQNADTDLDFRAHVFRHRFSRQPQTVREHFCGTAKLVAR